MLKRYYSQWWEVSSSLKKHRAGAFFFRRVSVHGPAATIIGVTVNSNCKVVRCTKFQILISRSPGRIRFRALVLHLTKNKFSFFIKIRYDWLTIKNIFRKNQKNLYF